MTSPSRPDRREPGSRDLTLALLAARLSELSEHAGRLSGRLDAAETAISAQASTLAEAADLAQEVTRLSAAIAGHGAASAARYIPSHPRQPVWAAMNDTEHADALRDLARWVSAILLRRYPATAPILPPCWPAHPAAVEELDWLYWDWTSWALEPEARSPRRRRLARPLASRSTSPPPPRTSPPAPRTAGTHAAPTTAPCQPNSTSPATPPKRYSSSRWDRTADSHE